MAQLELDSHRTPRNMNSLGLGSAGDKDSTWNCAPTENLEIWTAWAWDEQEIHGSTGTGPSYNSQESEQLGSEKCRRHTANLGLLA